MVKEGNYMEMLIGFLVLIMMGIILSRLAGILGSRFFKFSQIYKHVQESFIKLKKIVYK